MLYSTEEGLKPLSNQDPLSSLGYPHKLPKPRKNYGVSVDSSGNFSLSDVAINGKNLIGGGNTFGVSAVGFNCRVNIMGSAFSYLTYAIYTSKGTVIVQNVGADANTTGAVVESGGIIILSGSTPDLVGGSSNANWGGGMIVKSDGTLI